MARGVLTFFTPSFNVSASTNVFQLVNKNQLDEVYFTYDLNAEFILLPQDKLVHIF
jgi:curli production assembly/transport component CsgG